MKQKERREGAEGGLRWPSGLEQEAKPAIQKHLFADPKTPVRGSKNTCSRSQKGGPLTYVKCVVGKKTADVR